MNDDYNINNEDGLDENLSRENLPAIDGQIGMEELLVREEENNEEDKEQYIPPMDNQISLDDFFTDNNVLKDKDELLNSDPLGIFNNEKTEKLDDFFKTENSENQATSKQNSNQNEYLESNGNYYKDEIETGNENLEEDDYASPQTISRTLGDFYNESDNILGNDEGKEEDDDISINDLIGSEISARNNNNNNFDQDFKNKKTLQDGAFLGLNNDSKNGKIINNDIMGSKLNNANDTEKEEGLSILEDNYDNNNNNFNNGNNQDLGQNNNQNYNNDLNNNSTQNSNDFYHESNENYNNLGEDYHIQNNEDWNNFGNNENVDNNNTSDINNNYINNNNNNDDNDDNNDDGQNYNEENNNVINNFFSDETYGGNASNEDAAFNVDSNNNDYNNQENNFENNEVYNHNNYNENSNSVDSNANNTYNNLDNNEHENNNYNVNESANNNEDKNSFSTSANLDDSIINNNDVENNGNIDTSTDITDSKTNNSATNDDGVIDNIDNGDNYQEGIEVEKEPLVEKQNNSNEGNINKSKKQNNNSKIKLVEKQVRAKKPQKEKFFENEENVKVIEDVDSINKSFEEVNVVVGKDAFADYADSTLETGKIEETEVEDIKEKTYSENDGQDVVDGMLYKNLDTVLHESMIPYSEHVILDRALPRVEDGLKPVQRRILYSMLELGVTPDKPYRKSARIVGDCLGKYHPHGDTSVYDAMVRMAQPFNTNMLLVSGHGNFGSVDGDGAAAMRYTEAKLAPIAMELLRDLDKNTVKWGLNFDDTLREPEILPGRFPNLLVNGATGIAVGLATNIPPHNLAEAIDGVVAYLNNPSIKLKEMLKIIKGPDFPTGAYILNSSELYQAYETGRGKIYLRAKMHIESNGADKRYIVITELPYQVNKSSLLQKIALYKDEDRYGLGGISEVRDESDREGLRAVIRLKKDADLKAIYKSLLKNTELQTTFGINMVAIANGKPKQMGLLDIISYYAEYQREIIYRRSKYELEQAKEREHILAGLIIAIKNIDAVVKIIKTSQNTTEAKKRLKEKFNLSDRQAQAILDMRLAKLTSLEVYKLEEELKRLRELIQKLTAIIASKKLQKDIVKEEMLQIKRQYKQERKTKFAKAEEDIGSAPEPKEEANQKVVILKSVENNFKCVSQKQYNYAQKEVTDNSTLFDTHILKFETETNNTLIAFSSLGNCFKVDVKDFTQSRYRDKGVPEQAIFKELAKNERIVALFDNNITTKQGNFIFLTKFGMIKKTAFTEYSLLKKYYQGMKLRDDDEIIAIYEEPKSYTYIFVTKQGMVLNAENGDVPLQGRISGGVKGINLANNDYCVGVGLAGDGGEILAVTNKGYAKRVLVSNVDKSARYRKGLKFFTFTNDNGRELVFASVVTNPYILGCVDNENTLHYRSTDHVPIESRTGKGKVVDRMKKSLSILKAFAINN